MGFDELESQLRTDRSFQPGNGAAEEEVLEGERLLAIKITGGYRIFLRRFGWANLKYDSIYGLGSDVPSHLNVVAKTLSERTEMEPNMASHLLPLMNDGAGNHYCLDTHREENGEPPVVFWNHNLEVNQEPEVVAPSFADWLSAHLQDYE